MTIKKLADGRYDVNTGKLTADLRPIADVCELSGNVLRTSYREHMCHTVRPLRITLGPKSFAAVSALNVGETFSA